MRTPGVQRAQSNAKTPFNDPVICRSSRVRYPIKRFGFEGYAAHHYAYMVKVVRMLSLLVLRMSLVILIGMQMNEEMVALEANKTWDLIPLPKDKKAIGALNGFTK